MKKNRFPAGRVKVGRKGPRMRIPLPVKSGETFVDRRREAARRACRGGWRAQRAQRHDEV